MEDKHAHLGSLMMVPALVEEAGYRAYYAGKSTIHNPYMATVKEHFYWVDGWRKAQEERADRASW